MRVLVVEDDADLREALTSTIQDEGHEVVPARDGSAALEILTRHPGPLPDLVLLDLMMPNMDGQLFRFRQLSDERLAAIPTLVMTARTVDVATRTALGETPILRKPFDRDVLLAALLELAQPDHPSKACACGREYDREGWRKLRIVGEADNGREAGERLELRLCECRTTLAWELGRHARSIPMMRASKAVDP